MPLSTFSPSFMHNKILYMKFNIFHSCYIIKIGMFMFNGTKREKGMINVFLVERVNNPPLIAPRMKKKHEKWAFNSSGKRFSVLYVKKKTVKDLNDIEIVEFNLIRSHFSVRPKFVHAFMLHPISVNVIDMIEPFFPSILLKIYKICVCRALVHRTTITETASFQYVFICISLLFIQFLLLLIGIHHVTTKTLH